MAGLITIVGELVLQPPANLCEAAATISLNDTTMADAPAEIVATTRFNISGTQVVHVPFRLDIPAELPRNRRYTIAAEICRRPGRPAGLGNYLNMQSVPWFADSPAPVQIPVRLIGR
ncbi:MAG: YbaY family lipoprotein [Deltaproteobacteria bacterium]|nr:YbaY family lipoprotein [Deltaproteobacteria bacterium]